MLPRSLAPGFLPFAVATFLALPASAQRPLLSKQVPALVTSGHATRMAPLAKNAPLELVLSLPLRDKAGLDGLLADLYNPQSPNYRHWLTPAQFDARFAPTEADYHAVIEWARAAGFVVKSPVANRHILVVQGTAAVANRAFNVEVTKYHETVLNRDFQAPDREPSVSLEVPLLAISGLDTSAPRVNRLMKKPADGAASAMVHATSSTLAGTLVAAPTADFGTPRISGSGPSNTYLPSDMRAAYYGSGALTGAGQNVAVFSYDGYLTSSFSAWRTKTGVAAPATALTNVLTGGFDGGCELNSPCDDGEQILDVLQVQGMAPGLSNIYFYEGLSAVTEINQMLMDNMAPVVTCSWGGGDFGTGTAPLFMQMAAQGMTFVNATGDDGAYNGFSYLPASSDPYVLQVGGTDMVTASAGGAWSSEPGWTYSGGGFFDPSILIPTWQQTAGVITATNKGSATLRNAPDMALEANFDNSTAANGTYESGYGGTSYAAPRLAGYLALANQQSAANGYGTVGFINPTLYDLGLRSDAATTFHDVTSGSNPDSAGGPTVSFSATTGYDLVTGWGSPNGAGLINALSGPNFALSMASSSVSISRGATATLNLTVTPINGFTAAPTFAVAGLPTGVTSSLAQNSSTSYTLTLTASTSSLYSTGAVTVTATSGVINHAASFILNNIKRTNGDFTVSASNVTVVQQGTSGGSVVTVTPNSGFINFVDLALGALPTGVTASFDTTSTMATANITFTAPLATAPGTYPITITGSSAGQLAHSAIFYLTISPVASALADGGFENNSLSPWTDTTTTGAADSYLFCNAACGYYPHSGSNFFIFNNLGAVNTDTLSQQFTVSGGTTSATLNFWLWISSAETTTTTKNDTFTVTVTPSGGSAATIATFSNLNKGAGYVLYSYNLSAYLGQTVTLTFTGVENRSRATAFVLDDVSVVVQ